MEFVKHIHYSLELEEVILGACILEKEAYARIYDLLEEEVFYGTYHQTVYSAMHEMFDKGLFIDLLTVADYIKHKKNLPDKRI